MLRALRKSKETNEQPQEQHLNLQEVASALQKTLTDSEDDNQAQIFSAATAGVEFATAKAKQILVNLIDQHLIIVKGKSSAEVAEIVYQQLWGMGRIQEIYDDPAIDEIRVLPNGKVYVSRRGQNAVTDIKLDSHEIEQLIKRMVLHDTGVSLNESSPRLEAIRLDGSRLTALCPPVTKGFCFALRKHGTVDMSIKNLSRLGTLNDRVWKALALLVRGRSNILICGGVNSGKTSLLRKLIGELPPGLSIRVLDTDNEIRASEIYPDRDIIEMEDHPEANAPMKQLFLTILRLSPDVIIVGEFRGVGEAQEAIRACTRGHDGSMATAHFTSPAESIRGTAMLMLEEGLNLSLDQAQVRVAQAFNIVIQTFADSKRGIKKVVSVTEVEEKEGNIFFHELIRWEPFGKDYLGPGKWVFEKAPRPPLCQRMNRYGVTPDDIREVFTVE